MGRGEEGGEEHLYPVYCLDHLFLRGGPRLGVCLFHQFVWGTE